MEKVCQMVFLSVKRFDTSLKTMYSLQVEIYFWYSVSTVFKKFSNKERKWVTKVQMTL